MLTLVQTCSRTSGTLVEDTPCFPSHLAPPFLLNISSAEKVFTNRGGTSVPRVPASAVGEFQPCGPTLSNFVNFGVEVFNFFSTASETLRGGSGARTDQHQQPVSESAQRGIPTISPLLRSDRTRATTAGNNHKLGKREYYEELRILTINWNALVSQLCSQLHGRSGSEGCLLISGTQPMRCLKGASRAVLHGSAHLFMSCTVTCLTLWGCA